MAWPRRWYLLCFAIDLTIYWLSVSKGRAFMAEPRRRRGGDETAWLRRRHGQDNGVAETTRRSGSYGDVLFFRAAVPSATMYSHLAPLLLQV
jgi:hypothetical protein